MKMKEIGLQGGVLANEYSTLGTAVGVGFTQKQKLHAMHADRLHWNLIETLKYIKSRRLG